jgi:hypothetical protein
VYLFDQPLSAGFALGAFCKRYRRNRLHGTSRSALPDRDGYSDFDAISDLNIDAGSHDDSDIDAHGFSGPYLDADRHSDLHVSSGLYIDPDSDSNFYIHTNSDFNSHGFFDLHPHGDSDLHIIF